MVQRLKTLTNSAKKIISKETRRKIKKIKDKNEKIELYNHAIKSALEMKIHTLETIIKDLDKKEVDMFHLFTKTNLLKTKIKYYYTTYHKEDFEKIMKLLNEIEKDIDNI
jgi:ribosomal protein S20